MARTIDIDYIETPVHEIKPIKPVTSTRQSNLAKEEDQHLSIFKSTIGVHKIEIHKLKTQRKQLKNEIKKCKLLIKQARLVYKLSKIN